MLGYQIDQEIYNAAIGQGANKYLAKLTVAQARHETGNYGNRQTKENNNIFGFKYSKNSKFAKIGNVSPEGDSYAKYDSIGDAINDYFVRYWSKGANDKSGRTRLQHFNSEIQAIDADRFSRLLKSYGYYHTPSNKTDEDVISIYTKGLKSALTKINVADFVEKNKNYIAIGGGLLLLSIASIYIYNKKFKNT